MGPKAGLSKLRPEAFMASGRIKLRPANRMNALRRYHSVLCDASEHLAPTGEPGICSHSKARRGDALDNQAIRTAFKHSLNIPKQGLAVQNVSPTTQLRLIFLERILPTHAIAGRPAIDYSTMLD